MKRIALINQKSYYFLTKLLVITKQLLIIISISFVSCKNTQTENNSTGFINPDSIKSHQEAITQEKWEKQKEIAARQYIRLRDNGFVDSIYYCKKAINNKTTKYFLNRKNINKVYGYSHLHDVDVMNLHNFPDSICDKYLLLTDSFRVFHPKGLINDRIQLTEKQIDTLYQIINSYGYVNGYESGCFYPRHTFMFYNNKDEVIGYFQICFECSSTYSEPSYTSFFDGHSNKDYIDNIKGYCNRLGMKLNLQKD